ncbi:beta-1,3-glucan-binding protein-like [Mercenaria mercenaria]|uniref:beta-1,3-glucan-binding protein-like n=1 Tax=Mercenaria mercenaria TaxID=6596 RepID=UPI00234F3570|nr:beta-1,3-glucan-binding protein-like [Mercenaria mercenaria]
MGKDITDKEKELDDTYNKTAGYGIVNSVQNALGTQPGNTFSRRTVNLQTNPQERYDKNLIFSDQFDGNEIDASKWKHEISASGGGNWEFQIYSPEQVNSFIKDNVLYLRPTLTAEKFGEEFLYHGILDVEEIWGECTNTKFYGGYRDSKYGMISPVMSAKLMLQEKFSFRYGRAEVEAKMPKGDWIRPSIQLLPRDNVYGEWPSSGQIVMAESRGNLNYGRIGVENVTCTLHWGTQWNENRWEMTTGQKLGVDDVPVMTSVTPIGGYFKKGFFDGDNIWCDGGKNAPFDREFSLQFSLAVGGTNDYFPDFVQNVGYEKPWCNRDPRAAKKFYESRDKWRDTWNGEDAALKIRSVKIWSDKIS